MTHLTCPKCDSNKHTCGYGLAAGPMGSYCFCDDCNELLEASPDLEGLDATTASNIVTNLESKMKQVWGESWQLSDHLKSYKRGAA